MKYNGVLFVLALFLVGIFSDLRRAQAQSINVEVSPGKVQHTIAPGESLTQTFRIGNYSGATKTFYVYTRDFRVMNDEGAPVFDDEGKYRNDTYSLSAWMHVPVQQITVPNREVRTVDVTITAPANAEPGGHYGAFFVQTQDPTAQRQQDGSVIGSVGRIASLVLVTVPGDVTERIVLKDFATDQKVYWSGAPTIQHTARLENQGNVHAVPTGAIFVGGGIAYKGQSVMFNKEQGAVLPEAPARKITEEQNMRKVSLVPPMGKFQANMVTKYGSTGKGEISAQSTFYVIPIVFLLSVFLITLAVIFLIYRAVISFQRK